MLELGVNDDDIKTETKWKNRKEETKTKAEIGHKEEEEKTSSRAMQCRMIRSTVNYESLVEGKKFVTPFSRRLLS